MQGREVKGFVGSPLRGMNHPRRSRKTMKVCIEKRPEI
jgi:hypothetical protein